MKKIKNLFGWIAGFTLVVLGVLIWLFILGYSFTGYVFMGLGGLILCYRLLGLLENRALSLAKALRLILSILVCLGILAAVVTGTVIYDASLGDADRDCEYIVVLGAGLNGENPSLTLKNRLDAAYAYLAAHPDTVCVVSGGQGPDEVIPEAECMARVLTEMGIAPERIWQEDKSTSTMENLRFSLDLIEEKTGTRPRTVGIVSSEYHQYRAGLMAASLGAESVSIPGKTSWFSLWANYHMREIVAVWAYWLFG